MTQFLSTVSLVALCAVGAAAQDNDADPSADSDLILVTGVSLETLAGEALQPVESLSLVELQDGFVGGLGDALAGVPGVSSTYFGPAASRPIIRGLGGDRVRVLRNGVGLIDVSAVSVDHAVTSEVLEAERIDILRGASAIAYGGNAVGGVVNIVDGAIASEPVDGTFDGAFRAGYTSVDEGTQFAGRVSTGLGPLVFSLEASQRDAREFDIPGFAESALFRAAEEAEHEEEEGEEHEDEEEVSGFVPNTDYTFETLGAGASLIGDWGFAGVSVKLFDAEYGLPGGHEHEHEEGEGEEGEEEEGPDIFVGPRLDMNQVRIDSRGEFRFDGLGFDALTFAAGYSVYEHEEIEPNGEVATEFENEGWEIRAAAVRRGDGPLTGTVGFQALRTDFSALGEEAFVPPVLTEDFGVFGAGRYDLGGFGFEGGLRYERRDIEAVDGDVSALPDENVESRELLADFDPSTDLTSEALDQSFDLFSVSAGAFLRPTDNVFLSANLALTERAPADVELFAGGPHLATNAFEVGDPRLDKETAIGLDLGARYDADQFSIDAGVFVTEFEDFIFLAPTGGEEDGLPVFIFTQDDASFYGAEVAVEAILGEFAFGSLRGDASFEYVQAETDSAGDVPRIPPFSTTLGLDFSRDWFSARGEVIYAAEQDDVAAFELPTDSYTLLNLSATARPFTDNDVRLVFAIDNVTDEEARLHTSFLKDQVPLPGRSFKVSIASTF